MKRFILKCLLFLILLIGIDCATGAVFKYRDLAQDGEMGKINYLVKETDRDLLVMGSSRAVHSYNVKMLEDSLGLRSYNAGFDGRGIVLATGLLDIIADNHIPRVILYELTPSFDLFEDDKTKYLSLLRPYWDYAPVRELVKEVSYTEYFKWQSSLYRLNSYLFSFCGNVLRGGNDLNQGFLPIATTMDYEPTSSQSLERNIDQIKLNMLDRLVQYCKGHNVELICTISPIYSYADTTSYSIIEYELLSRGIPVLNHLQDKAFAHNKRYFSDRTHLNSVGADTLTSVISSELKSLLN